MLFSVPLIAQQRRSVALQALMAAGEAARATLALRVLLDEHKSNATTLLLLTKALLQTGSTVAVQDAVIMARWGSRWQLRLLNGPASSACTKLGADLCPKGGGCPPSPQRRIFCSPALAAGNAGAVVALVAFCVGYLSAVWLLKDGAMPPVLLLC